MVNATNSSANPDDHITCSPTNWVFLVDAGSSMVIISLIALITVIGNRKPVPGKPFHGFAYVVGGMLYSIALWNMLPQATFFVLFHEIIPSFAELTRDMGCFAVNSPPFIAGFLFLQGTWFLVMFRPKEGCAQLRRAYMDDSDITTPAAEDGSPARVLLLGPGPGLGLLFSERLRREQNGSVDAVSIQQGAAAAVTTRGTRTEAVAITQDSYDHARNNIVALGVCDKLDDVPIQRAESRGAHDIYVIPHADETFDKVIVPPLLRNAPPVGSFFSAEKTKQARMFMVWREVLRVLKPGGSIFLVDAALDVLLAEADLKDIVGADNVSVRVTGDKFGSVKFFERKKAVLNATKPDHFQMPAPPKFENRLAPVTGTTAITPLLKDDETEGTPIPVPHVLAIVAVLQILVFFGLCFFAAALYGPCNGPMYLALESRANFFLPSVATGYPMMAYLQREVQYIDGRFSSYRRLLATFVISTGVAIMGSIIFTFVFGLPSFLLALSAHGVAGAAVLNIIGITLSIGITVASLKTGRRATTKKTFKERKLDERYLKDCM